MMFFREPIYYYSLSLPITSVIDIVDTLITKVIRLHIGLSVLIFMNFKIVMLWEGTPWISVCVRAVYYPFRRSYIIIQIGLLWSTKNNNHSPFSYCQCNLCSIWSSFCLLPHTSFYLLFLYVFYKLWGSAIWINSHCCTLVPHMILPCLFNWWYHCLFKWMI